MAHSRSLRESPNGGKLYRRNLLATLREREIAPIGAEMAATKALPFRAATDGESLVASLPGSFSYRAANSLW